VAIVTFPDGTHVRAASLADCRADDHERAFGLYLDERWAPYLAGRCRRLAGFRPAGRT
jgi:hypothetical protein